MWMNLSNISSEVLIFALNCSRDLITTSQHTNLHEEATVCLDTPVNAMPSEASKNAFLNPESDAGVEHCVSYGTDISFHQQGIVDKARAHFSIPERDVDIILSPETEVNCCRASRSTQADLCLENRNELADNLSVVADERTSDSEMSFSNEPSRSEELELQPKQRYYMTFSGRGRSNE